MKKIVLIVLTAFGQSIFSESSAQDKEASDSLYYDAITLSARFGIIQGFEVIDLKNADITMGMPLGVDIKFYGTKKASRLYNFLRYRSTDPLKFWQLGESVVPILILRNFTYYIRSDIKYGFVNKNNYSVMTIGFSFYQNFAEFGDMFGGEFSIQSQNVPISVAYMHNPKLGINYYVVGLNLTFGKWRLKRGTTFGY